MTQKNRYKFNFGKKPLVLTTDKDNLFMEEVERLAREKYDAIKAKLPHADNETVAILMAINSLSVQLQREIELGRREALASPSEVVETTDSGAEEVGQ